jgi:hypothetical protein
VGRLRRYESSSLRGARLEDARHRAVAATMRYFGLGLRVPADAKANARPDGAAFAYLMIFKSS